ncbi:MAG: glutamyl-tRNA reductase [Bacteroidia bacterium]
MSQVAFRVVSLSHERAPVAIRELIHLDEQVSNTLLQRLRDVLGITEAMIFSTCNRTEIYYRDAYDHAEALIKMLCMEKGITDAKQYQDYFRVINSELEAVHYLFKVSMGLHSQVLGDIQIASQIKQAYRVAHELGMAGAFMHRLLHTIFHANKRVQQETPFRDGAASVSYAATELAAELVSHVADPSVLVIGLGEMGRDVARNLDQDRFARIGLCNRTRSKAETLAKEVPQSCVEDMEALSTVVNRYDVVIAAVSVEKPLITAELVKNRIASQILIDLCVPRAIDPDVDNLPQIVRFAVDDINNRTQATLEIRKEAIPQVEAIILQELDAFFDWSRQLSISPTIHKLKAALEEIRKEQLAKFLKRASDEEAQLIDEVTRSMMNKLIRMPVLQLKDACKRGEEEEMIDLLNGLFNLEEQSVRTDKM